MLALREFTVDSLQKHSGINPTTVRTVLLRREPILEKIGFVEKAHPGGKAIRYRLKPQAETELRNEIGEVFNQVTNWPEANLETTAPLKAPLGLLAAENALLRRFPQADDTEEKRELLGMAERELVSGHLELRAIASETPKKGDAVRALMQSVGVLKALSRAELNAASGKIEEAYKSFPAIYRESLAASNALYISGQDARAQAFSERVRTSPFIESVIQSVSANLGLSHTKNGAHASVVGGTRYHNMTAGLGASSHSIAVLPLMGDRRSQTYIYDGLTQGIWSKVCELPDLTVVNPSRVSAGQVNAEDPQLVRDLGRKLDVEAILFGNVSVKGSQVRCNAKLLSVESGVALWQQSYDTPFEQVFSVGEDISTNVFKNLHIDLTDEEKAQLAERPTTDSEAHKLYMKGRYKWMQWTAEGIESALDDFEQALKKDRSYALAHAGLADCYNMCTYELGIPPGECFPKAKAAAYEALEFDENLAEAYTALAYSRLRYYWSWNEAEENYLRAIDLNPNYTLARLWYAEYLSAVGRFDEAIAHINKAERLDPESLIISVTAGSVYYFAGDYDRAIEQFLATLKKDESFIRAHFRLGGVYLQKGMHAEAIKELTTAVKLSNHNPREESSLGYAYAVAGKHDLARKALVRLKKLSRRRYVSCYNVALIYAGLGDVDAAFNWLERACKDPDPWLVFLKVDPRLSSLRGDSRFSGLNKTIGNP